MIWNYFFSYCMQARYAILGTINGELYRSIRTLQKFVPIFHF